MVLICSPVNLPIVCGFENAPTPKFFCCAGNAGLRMVPGTVHTSTTQLLSQSQVSRILDVVFQYCAIHVVLLVDLVG